MEQYLSILNDKFLRKRIKREIEILIKENICIENDIKIKDNIDCINNFEYIISFKNLNNNKFYKFIISNNYPFNPPKLHINDKPISFYHQITNLDFLKNLKKYTGIQCFCCETILCSDNWSPAFTMSRVINDIDKCKDARHQVIIRIIVDVIKRKYLIDDTNIIEWLY